MPASKQQPVDGSASPTKLISPRIGLPLWRQADSAGMLESAGPMWFGR
jgi:hypothetical protein